MTPSKKMKKKKMKDDENYSDEDNEEIEPVEVEELKQCMIELEKINQKIEVYDEYLKDKTLEFNGYNKISPNDKSIPSELKRKCVNAVMRGDINEVEFILESSDADINLTWFSENLLMVAIRAHKESMAEFLITKGINVSHEIELKEFTEEAPINYYKYSCRDMAFDYGLYNIINLIDIFNENTNENIIQFLGEKYLQNNLKFNKNIDKDSHNSYKKHLDKFDNVQQNELIKDDLSDKLDAASEINIFKEIEDLKPSSGYGYKMKGNISNKDEAWDAVSERSISTASLISSDAVIKNPLSYKNMKPSRAKDQKELTQNILERIKTKKTKSNKSEECERVSCKSEIKNESPENNLQKFPPLVQSQHQISTSYSVLTPRTVQNDPMYLKKNETIKVIKDKYLLKELHDKLSNHRYLSYLGEKPETKKIIENNIKKYNEPMFPLGSIPTECLNNETNKLKLPSIIDKRKYELK